MSKSTLTAIAPVLALAALSPGVASAQAAPPEPIRIGVIDTSAARLADPGKGISVEVRDFVREGRKAGSHRTPSGREHGVEVMSSFVEQARAIDRSRPIHVLSAVAFYQSGDERIDDMKNRPMRIDLEQAEKALDWFKENGVRSVVVAFVMPNSPAMERFMGKARENHISVFAATNNLAMADPFPARHPDAIAVTGSDRNLDFQTSGTMRDWVAFQASGKIAGSNSTMTENGSSFAVGRVAAFGAFLQDADPSLDRRGLVDGIRAVSDGGRVPSLSGDGPVRSIRHALSVASRSVRAPVPDAGVRVAARRAAVTVGVLDVGAADGSSEIDGVQTVGRSFVPQGAVPASWSTSSGRQRGQMVADAFVSQVRGIDRSAPVKVMMASAMYENGPRGADGRAPMAMDYEGARRAMSWFADNGVKVVVTTMASDDTPGMRSVMAEARARGIAVFAGASSSPTRQRSFPAAYPEAISVASVGQGQPVVRDMGEWVNFAIDGDQSSVGAPFAVARAAAFGAWATFKGVPVSELRPALASLSMRMPDGSPGSDVARIDRSSAVVAARAIVGEVPVMQDQSPARGAIQVAMRTASQSR